MKLNILEIEDKKKNLYNNLSKNPSRRQKTFLYYNFFSSLLDFSDQLTESYILEFIENYTSTLSYYSPFYAHPAHSNKILNQVEVFLNKGFLVSYNQALNEAANRLKNELLYLEEILDGITSLKNSNYKIYFPLLEESYDQDIPMIGILETLTIQIKKTKDKNKFIIVPSEKEIEEKIETQVQDSWSAAERIASTYYKKIAPAHEIIISFDQKEGIYIGDSLGTALTIGFITEILRFYNASILVNIKTKVAFTGGITSNGELKGVSKKIVEQKTECVFYSDVQTFVVSKEDEKHASKKLEELKEKFQQRDLTIVGVTDLDEILDRRKIIDIKKQHVIVRTAKFSKKNWVSLTLVAVLFLVILAAGWLDFDTNPVQVEFENNMAHIENKNGKVLWTYKTMNDNDNFLLSYAVRFTDINNDKTNEVIVSGEYYHEQKENSNYGRIACFDNKKNLIWKYSFHDRVSSTTFEGIDVYRSFIIGIEDENGKKVVYAMSKNRNLYPSAIFKLNAKTGKRIDSLNTLWNAGTITNALIGDFNNDDTLEIVGTAIHNGFQRSVLFSVDLNNLGGQTPAPLNYTFANMNAADLNAFVLLPKSDYSDLYYRFDMPKTSSLVYNSVTEQFKFDLIEGVVLPSQRAHLNFVFDNKFRLVYLGCGDDFQMKRDSLIARGILKPPYSNTPEYFNSLKQQIRYWNGEEFVKVEEYFME